MTTADRTKCGAYQLSVVCYVDNTTSLNQTSCILILVGSLDTVSLQLFSKPTNVLVCLSGGYSFNQSPKDIDKGRKNVRPADKLVLLWTYRYEGCHYTIIIV